MDTERFTGSQDGHVVEVVGAVLEHEQHALGARTENGLGLARLTKRVAHIVKGGLRIISRS